VYALDCTPPLARIAGYAPQVARAMDEILAATGARQVVLIGHSMGGLVCRAYIDQFGTGKVAHIITLGTPHGGTWMTQLGLGPGVRNMDVQSGWLAGLREREAAGSATPYANFTCIFTYHDNLVTPQINATLPGANQIALSGIGHVSLVLSNAVLGHVLHVLDHLPVTQNAGEALPRSQQGGAQAQK
jgi:triacylglycerol esterase/lipase EstA (alpha/beta hydrolase family)